MLYWAAVFLVLALLAARLGVGGLAGTLSWAAQLLFVVFVILMIVAGVARALQGRAP
jgi:uncharacterized membrane protein YtjA (UPF0391 family)